MNTANILKLAERLEQNERPIWHGEPVGFDMRSYFTTGCGTSACIAGWAAVVASQDQNWEPRKYKIRDRAKEWLDLTDAQARELFTPSQTNELAYCDITPAIAARTLRYLASTGTVDWSLE